MISYIPIGTHFPSEDDEDEHFSNPEPTFIFGPSKDDTYLASGYKSSSFLTIVYHFGGIFTCGFVYLLAYWRPDWAVFWKRRKVPLEDADTLILKDIDGVTRVVSVKKELVQERILLEHFASCSENDNGDVHQNLQELGGADETREVNYFVLQYLKYIWNDVEKQYQCIIGIKKGATVGSLLRDYTGYTAIEEDLRSKLYGKNEIGIEIKSYCHLLVSEVLNPFYIFQIASIILWSMDDYYLYAFCIFIISCLSIGVSLYETRKQSESIRNLVESSNPPTVKVSRLDELGKKTEVDVDACDVVPGDILVISPTGCVMACDAVLISGTAIVNESMLTGESVPVTKVSFAAYEEMEIYSTESHKKHTLFCGTAIIQTRYYGKDQVLALVTRTGFNTAKGELIRSILYPRPIDFKFYKDSLKFIGMMFVIALIGMTYSIYLYVVNAKPLLQTIVRALDIITIVVPPALPAAMTVGTYYAQNRLKRLGIFCIAPARINVCGKVKLVCFDKTGTLTEDGLEVWGVIASEEGIDSKPVLRQPSFDLSALPYKSCLSAALASCHSLTYVNGVLTGDPLDLKMFEATKWAMESTFSQSDQVEIRVESVVKSSFSKLKKFSDISHIGETSFQIPYEIGVIRQFPFSSSVQRMSVIVRVLGSPFMEVYTKGAPEVIQMLCQPNSVPGNFNGTLNHFAMQGFRVLAMAHKRFPQKTSWHIVQKMKRDQVECDLMFLGLIIFQNVLKQETTPVIQDLKMANIRSVMVTGDNILTGICVARDCGMVDSEEDLLLAKVSELDGARTLSFELAHSGGLSDDYNCDKNQVGISLDSTYHLAVSGPAWHLIQEHFPEYVPFIVAQGTVFARMSPDQKVQLVEELQALDYIVGMCGDGANDCGALKAAHIGISLSEAEASVAAPFTSRTPDITCVPKIICEGRCALATNFSVFKYMALYSIIQFVAVLILYKACSNLSDPQFLYVDLLIVTMVAIFMGRTKARHVLVPQRPLSSLIGPMNLFSVASQIILVIIVQVFSYYYLLWQPWFLRDTDCHGDKEVSVTSWETNVIFCLSSLQYLSLAIIYSPGYPFRKAIYTNVWLLITITTLTCTSVWLLLYPLGWMEHLMLLKPFPGDPIFLFRGTLLLIALFHFVVGWSVEHFIAGSKPLKYLLQFLSRKKHPKNKFKRVKIAMESDPNWPPVEAPIFSCASS